MKRLISSALLVIAAAVPAAAQDREQLQILAELRMMQEQSGQLRALIASLEEALKALNAKLDQQADASRKGFADQKVQIDSLRETVGVVREKVDDTNVRISTLSHEVETLRSSVASAAAAAASQQQTQPATPPGDPAAPPSPQTGGSPGTPPVSTLPAQKLIEMAMGDYLAGSYALARDGFRAYLRSHPTAPRAAEAQYYVGETFFGEQNYKEAITEYGVVITNYKDEQWVSDAMYKQGFAFQNLKEYERARQAYELVLKRFPDSKIANLAKQRLQGLPR